MTTAESFDPGRLVEGLALILTAHHWIDWKVGRRTEREEKRERERGEGGAEAACEAGHKV